MSGVIPRIMIVEDEQPIRELVAMTLEAAGFEAQSTASVEEAEGKLREALPQALILDWMLPGKSGIHFARQLRSNARTKDLPILMLTARGTEADRVSGLETGADDYITKPFSPRELVARLRTVLRRCAPQYGGELLEAGGVRLDTLTMETTVDGQAVTLGPTEFKLLRLFLAHPGRVFSRPQLLDLVWGDHRFVEERTVDVGIRRLRAALGERGEALVETVRGVGYRFKSS